MKMFVFKYIDKLTGRYHPEGGSCVIAKDIDEAKSILNKIGANPTEEELKSAEIFELDGNYESKSFIFPDSGCC